MTDLYDSQLTHHCVLFLQYPMYNLDFYDSDLSLFSCGVSDLRMRSDFEIVLLPEQAFLRI